MLLMVIYMSNIQKSFICLIIFCFGIIFLYYRLYDKKLRNNIIKIGILLIFWMLTRIIKALIIDENSEIFLYPVIGSDDCYLKYNQIYHISEDNKMLDKIAFSTNDSSYKDLNSVSLNNIYIKNL